VISLHSVHDPRPGAGEAFEAFAESNRHQWGHITLGPVVRDDGIYGVVIVVEEWREHAEVALDNSGVTLPGA
jgi:hypothetical protein